MFEVEKRLGKILASALEGVAVEPAGGDSGVDLVIRTRDGRTIALQVKWAGEGWPQDVRRVATGIEGNWPANLVLLAHRFSPGAIEWLRDRGANWADEAGQVRILGPEGLIVIREPAQLPKGENVSRAFAWSKSTIALAEVILARQDRPLRVAELADAGDWSVAQAANVLKAFDGQGWTAKRGAARGRGAYRELVDPNQMLAAWSAGLIDAPRATRIAHRATNDVMALLRDDLGPSLNHGARWAVSGWAGLELAVPFATTTPSLHLYISDTDFAGPLSNVIEKAGLREVDEGGRVTFWAADPRLLTLAERVDDIPVVSPPRLFADLTSFGGRGGDVADHVKEQLIDPLHPAKANPKEAVDG